MKQNQIFLFFLFVMISVFSCKNNTDSYKTPYEPGVYVDKEAFESHKQLWEENKIKNYTYTYSYEWRMDKTATHSYSYKIDVTVENGEVSQYVLKEHDGKTEQDESSENWTSYKESLDIYTLKKDSNFFLIENLYSKIENKIEASQKALNKDPECYYHEIEFDFIDEKPFILSCCSYTLIMEEKMEGNSGCEEFKIENFKAL